MKEIKSLFARSDRYLKSAGLLINDKDYESAVSRAYYAMFFAVEAALLTKEISFSSHKAVLSAFGEHFVKTGVFTNRMLKKSIHGFFNYGLSEVNSARPHKLLDFSGLAIWQTIHGLL